MEAGCCRYIVTDGEGLLGVWYTADNSSFFQVLGTNVVILQQKLAGVKTEPLEGAGKVGTIGESLGGGGIG